MPINLFEDWNAKFGITKQKPEPVPIPSVDPETLKKPVARPAQNKVKYIEVEDEVDDDEPLDLVVDRKPKRPKPDTWKQNVTSQPTNIPTKGRVIHTKEPVVTNRKVYISSGTANWGLVRAGVYPKYKEYCLANGMSPSITEFNSIIAPQWRALNPEEKVMAANNPLEYFTFE